jgi:hypothetical protein
MKKTRNACAPKHAGDAKRGHGPCPRTLRHRLRNASLDGDPPKLSLTHVLPRWLPK